MATAENGAAQRFKSELDLKAPAADQPYQFNTNETYNEKVYSDGWKQHRPSAYFDYRRAWDEIPAQ